MKQWTDIRVKVLRDGVSKREILRQTGMHWKTLEKMLQNDEPPGYRMKNQRGKPKSGPFLERIREIIESDKQLPKKQRHTAKRIYERIKQEGYQGHYTVVREAVREIKRLNREVFMPLVHRPGEAQVDFGQALARIAGVLRKVWFFVMALPYSDAFFVMAFERECTETYWEGHKQAFTFFGGVPRRISYDNSRVLVSKIIGTHKRELTYGFLQLKSHYLFEEHFCRVRRPNEKGVVEGMVKYSRLNFFVPVPQVRDLDELNDQLQEGCRNDLNRHLRGKKGTKSELLVEDQAAFLPHPGPPFDACRKQSTTATSLSLVRFDDNDYSVPVRYAHHPITIIQCLYDTHTIRLLLRGMLIEWYCFTRQRKLQCTGDHGPKRGCFSNTNTTCHCWKGNRELWTMHYRWPTWICRSVSIHCVVGWRQSKRVRVKG
jgi:transposase